MKSVSEAVVAFRTRSGDIIGQIRILCHSGSAIKNASLIELDPLEARVRSETIFQLRESERYEYEVLPGRGTDLRLRCHLATRRRSLADADRDSGILETRSFCGTLMMELVEGEDKPEKAALGTAFIDVRSIKLGYRTEFRGMLCRLADELISLVADLRSPVKAAFRSDFDRADDIGLFQFQIELLREIIDNSEFQFSLRRIIDSPHEQLETNYKSVSTDRPIRWTGSSVKKLITGHPRRAVSPDHPLTVSTNLSSVSARVSLARKVRTTDTPENRFMKFILREFREFLTKAALRLRFRDGWQYAEMTVLRLSETVNEALGRGFFRDVGDLSFVALGSPVLQGRSGYQDMFRYWLRFRSYVSLNWSGGNDLFHTGQKNVADLYEYWLFFVLLSWFCRIFRDGVRPASEDLIEGMEGGFPSLKLTKGRESQPISGTYSNHNRKLISKFSYNRNFRFSGEYQQPGSWTRRMRPDFTVSFWPAEFSESEAERMELLVHIHFDAKYRVEDINSLFPDDPDEGSDDHAATTHNRQDLLKMHAYRDAIKRSQGAYILYPGRVGHSELFRGFHEILPGLGAFAIFPDKSGKECGMKNFEKFMDDVMMHLSDRASAREAVSYHVVRAKPQRHASSFKNNALLGENDRFSDGLRGPPFQEHLVLVLQIDDPVRLQRAGEEEGLLFLQISESGEDTAVHPDIGRIRHILIISRHQGVQQGLLILRQPGFRIISGQNLGRKLDNRFTSNPGDQSRQTGPIIRPSDIYILFETAMDMDFSSVVWDNHSIFDVVHNSGKWNLQKSSMTGTGFSEQVGIIALSDLLSI